MRAEWPDSDGWAPAKVEGDDTGGGFAEWRATTMSYTSTVPVDHPRVDAFQIDLDGSISQPSEVAGRRIVGDFTAIYALAPQYGGLIVQEVVEITSNVVSRTVSATINSVPDDLKPPPHADG